MAEALQCDNCGKTIRENIALGWWKITEIGMSIRTVGDKYDMDGMTFHSTQCLYDYLNRKADK